MKRFALTTIGRDRPGIVAAVTKVLYEHGCNIEDSSMTILEDEFAIILIMSMPDEKDIEELSRGLKKIESSMGLTINLKEIPKESAEKSPPGNYIITLHGADKAGIVYKTTELLARSGINITDLETKLVGKDNKAYIMVIEAYLPSDLNVEEIEDELRQLEESLEVVIKLKPVEATEPL